MFFGSGKVLVIGEKETFIIKVLLGKLNDAKIETAFASENVNAINENWPENGIIAYYMEAGAR